jgi:flagellar protein FliS
MGRDQENSFESASAIDLVVTLYDGILRFLRDASEAAERGDQASRRMAVKGALDIINHLQARLRLEVGGRPAQVLNEFYASVFSQILQASQSASRRKFEHTINCVRSVRDAWQQAAHDSHVLPASRRAIVLPALGHARLDDAATQAGAAARSIWTD